MNCKKMQLQSQLVECANRLCFEDKLQYVKVMRLLLKNFRIIFTINYRSVLADLVKKMQDKLVVLLKNMPQILPFGHGSAGNKQEQDLCQGIWGDITDEEWKSDLFIDNITTIYNKSILQDLIKQVQFKRHHYSVYGLILLSRSQLEQIHS